MCHSFVRLFRVDHPPSFDLENPEFAESDRRVKLLCEGRACAKCQKCCDWHFTGDQTSWNWIARCSNWKQSDWDRYYHRDGSELFIKRDGATCKDRDLADGVDGFRLSDVRRIIGRRSFNRLRHICVCDKQ